MIEKPAELVADVVDGSRVQLLYGIEVSLGQRVRVAGECGVQLGDLALGDLRDLVPLPVPAGRRGAARPYDAPSRTAPYPRRTGAPRPRE